MKTKLEFLGQCHAPNLIRGLETPDRKQVWIEETNYNYSLDSDSETIAEHALKLHFENSKETISEECILSVRSQLGLCPQHFEAAPLEIVPVKKVAKKAVKKAKKSIKEKAKK